MSTVSEVRLVELSAGDVFGFYGFEWVALAAPFFPAPSSPCACVWAMRTDNLDIVVTIVAHGDTLVSALAVSRPQESIPEGF